MSTPTFDGTTFAASLLSVGNGALVYIGGGVAAGVVILAVTLGIRKGISALRSVGK
jgi:Ethanolamine utilization protein EutJ (predicted chaperonin)